MSFTTPKAKRLIGGGLAIIGLSALTMSYLIVSTPIQEPNEEMVSGQAIGECLKTATEFGAAATRSGRHLQVTMPGLEDWKRTLAETSIIIAECHGMTLNAYCMGSQCSAGSGQPIMGAVFSLSVAD